MKFSLLLSALLFSSLSFADTSLSCGAAYVSGMNHLIKGEISPLGDKGMLSAGESTGDDFYTFSMGVDGVLILKETKSGKDVELALFQENEGFSLYSTVSLDDLYPVGVPGAYADHMFVMVMCSSEQK